MAFKRKAKGKIMIIDQFYEAIEGVFKTVRETQREAIIAAGKMMADAMCEGKMIHIHDTGHLINFEMINRSGGLVAPKQLVYYLVTQNDGRPRPELEKKDRTQVGMAQLVINAGNICPGDLLIIGSVSGRNEQVVDLAITAKEYGCKIIALTSMKYTTAVESAHPSGKKLYEIADLVLDNCAPLGDGMLDVEGLEMPFIPASGMSATYVMWSVYAACVEEMLSRGITPGIYKSSNTPGGDEYNLEMEHRWEKYGY